jgi:hypothetical protein
VQVKHVRKVTWPSAYQDVETRGEVELAHSMLLLVRMPAKMDSSFEGVTQNKNIKHLKSV